MGPALPLQMFTNMILASTGLFSVIGFLNAWNYVALYLIDISQLVMAIDSDQLLNLIEFLLIYISGL